MISLLTSPGHSRRCLRHVCAAALATLLVATPLFAANCWDATHPDSRYTVNSTDGTVVDTNTGLAGNTKLMWKQCHEGLSGSNCGTGLREQITFDAAVRAGTNSTLLGYNDWRAPNLDELLSLVAPKCGAPSINGNVFPATPNFDVWSGSPDVLDSSLAWRVSFNNGIAISVLRSISLPVRLVRGGQSLDPSVPTPQTLAFGAAPTLIKGASGASVSATSNGAGANSGNPIDFFSATPDVCEVGQRSGEILVSGSAAVGDTCTILANQYGRINNGVNYAPGQATQSMLIGCWDTHPDSRYAVNNGTVLDTATGLNGNNNLMWKQCVEGLSGASCVGTASTMSFDDAAIAGGSSSHANYNDWRAPTLAELQTLVPSACASGPYSPTINRTVFPATPSTATWTTTSTTTFFWLGAAVDFMGGSDSNLQVTNANPVRLVRGGLSLPSTPQTLAFGPAPSLLLGTSPAVSATNTAAINSGNPIRYSSATPLVCSVDSLTGQITLANTAAAGNTCTINADQYGRINNGVNYAPAAQVAQSLIVVAPVNGTCATLAPSTTAPANATLCSAGTAANFAGGVNTFTWACNGANGGSNVTTCSSIRQYTVTTNAGANGTLSCTTPVNGGATTTCTSTPNAGYRTASISGCNGTASAPGINSYTTGAIVGDCQVSSTYEAMIDGICATPAASITAPANATLCSAGTAANFASGVNTFTWACNGANGGSNVTTCSSIRQYTVTTNAGANGTLSCTTPVNGGATASCTSTPNNGYRTASISGCNGTATAPGVNNYTTGAIIGDCQVSSTYEAMIDGICATPAASITAPANATLCSAGTAANFASSVNTFTWACNGSNGGSNVTTCSSIRQYNVTTNAGANGTLSCTTPVNGGATTTCTSTPNAGYRTASISGCNGTASGPGVNSYTTGAIVADCQVSASFESLAQNIVWAPLNPSLRALDLVGSFAINPLAVGGASGNPVTYTSATPLVCSVSGMNGVNVTQLGLGVCTITANQQGDTIYSAAIPVSQSVTFFAILDIDASGVGDTRYHALTDGQLIMRYLLNVTGPALTAGVTAQTALRTDPAVLLAHLNAMRNALDVDGNTVVDPATDGVLILRYLLGFRGSALIADAVATTPAPSRATALLIEQYLQGLTP